MGKLAFVFSGQGDQRPGMGRDLVKEYPAAARVFALCDRLRPGTAAQCFGGAEEELRETKNTQPCLFALELAAARVLLERGVRPDAMAGFSLGEVAAAAAAGLFDDETGFRLVCKRGLLMQREAEKEDTAMMAVVRLSAEQVEALCAGFPKVYPVNFNCPGQVAVSGLAEEMAGFSAAVREAGGRTIPLKVKGAFHSPFMAQAAREFARELAAVPFREPRATLYSDLTGEPYAGDPARLLSEQISGPVQWEKLVRGMIAAGVDSFVEIGPGSTLTNIIRKIDGGVSARTYTDYLSEVCSC